MRSLRLIVSALTTGAAIWACIGVAVWFFLGTPYAVAAARCLDEKLDGSRVECLKPVAKNLRADSNIATYATATVAAIIALQLSRRASENRPDDSDRLTNGPAIR